MAKVTFHDPTCSKPEGEIGMAKDCKICALVHAVRDAEEGLRFAHLQLQNEYIARAEAGYRVRQF